MDIERARKARRSIARLAQSRLDTRTLAARTEELLRSVIPFDRACWHNIDPATSMLTSIIGETAPTNELLPVLEYGTRDFNQYSDLARRPAAAAGLHAATRGTPGDSRRYREVLEPMRLRDELTATFVIDSMLWGSARLFRGPRWPAFDEGEIAFMASLAAPLAQGFRAALVKTAAVDLSRSSGAGSAEGPGVVLLNSDGSLASMTPAARRWLGDVIDDTSVEGSLLPDPLVCVASRARAIAGDRSHELVARSRVPTRSGGWLVLHGECMALDGDERISIIVEPAAPPAIAPLIVNAYGLSGREQQVMRFLLQGMSNKEIARSLGLSAYTVSDHVRVIFDKVGVHSRTELAARLFFNHCYPGIAEGRPLGESGWFT